MSEPGCNIALRMADMAKKLGDKRAVSVPNGTGANGKVLYRHYTFSDVEKESARYANGLADMGVGKGARVLLMVRPGFEFLTLTFALFKTGAVPVLIDPGMGKSNLLNCIAQSQPEGFVAIPLAHMARLIYPGYFKSVSKFVTVGRRYLWGGKTHLMLKEGSSSSFPVADTKAEDTAAILFTTGSTGIPKGVVYTHGVFNAQVDLIRDRYSITFDDADLPAFPLFALFSIAMGMRVVIPDMDPTRPATADPKKLTDAINEQGVTFTFGSPAIWKNVSGWCVENNVKLPTLKRVLMAGAPVANEIHERLLNGVLQEGASTHTPFGATESLPVTDIKGAEVLNETAILTAEGKGYCVGKPLHGMSIEIIGIDDEPIEKWSDGLKVSPGEKGEIVVRGPVVTHEYFNMPTQTGLAKIKDEATNEILHRMGDIGYLDEKGRLWFCGRKTHRVETEKGMMLTIPCEAIFNAHPAVARTALVGVGDPPDQTPVIIAELEKSYQAKSSRKIFEDIAKELFFIGQKSETTDSIGHILFHEEFPTDIRHNAKIFREKLKTWAETKLDTAYKKS